jgi:Family of unknown function (DUF5317)
MERPVGVTRLTDYRPMTVLVLITLFGFIGALALGGTFAGWRAVRVHWWPLAILPLAAQLFLYNPPIDTQPWAIAWGPYLFILAKATMVAMLLKNALASPAYRAAFGIAAFGVALNLLVIAANGGYMPQSAEARMTARGTTLLEGEESTRRLRNVSPIDDSTRLPFLGEVVAQPTWMPRSNVISIGDLFLAGGVGMWAFQVTYRVRRGPVRRIAAADS